MIVYKKKLRLTRGERGVRKRKNTWLRALSAGLAEGIGLLYRRGRADRELRLLQEKRAALEEISRRSRELAHNQRLQTLGTHTSSVAHEFNNLLTPIMGYSLMAMELLPEQEGELYDDLLEIYRASDRARETIARLSALYGKSPAPARRMVEPNALVHKALSTVRPSGVEVETALECRDAWVLGDETQLIQILVNLILNACHAMEGGGRLTLSTRSAGGKVLISVADTGRGIPRALLSRVFEPFFTTKGVGQGTGLGLAIARQVAEEHGGRLTADSKEGEGSVFTVTLPAVPPSEGKTLPAD